ARLLMLDDLAIRARLAILSAAGRDRPTREGVSMPCEPPTLEALARRLDGLERTNRRLRRGLGVTLIGGAAIFLMGQAPERFSATTVVAQNIETQSLIVRDASGKVRAVLDADAAGPVSLTFSDKEGRERSAIGVGPAGGVGVVFRDREGAIR